MHPACGILAIAAWIHWDESTVNMEMFYKKLRKSTNIWENISGEWCLNGLKILSGAMG